MKGERNIRGKKEGEEKRAEVDGEMKEIGRRRDRWRYLLERGKRKKEGMEEEGKKKRKL